MESVYIETTFISYLVARPSGDLLVAAHQKTTQDWWPTRQGEFRCHVSQFVIDEISVGDPTEAQKRLTVVDGLLNLEVSPDVISLAGTIMAAGMLPPHAHADAAHVAVATVHGVDFLLTWNCKHLANAQIARQIARVCEAENRRMPVICTPEQLMGS